MECSADIFGVEIKCRQKVHDIAEERTVLPVVAIADRMQALGDLFDVHLGRGGSFEGR